MLLALFSFTAFAEPSFQQIESLIEKQQYSAAEQGLEQVIAAHPQSAKAYYAMAQAQAGLGNNVKAKFALDKAMGIDPDLKFASSSNIESLQQAITPQVKKIEVVSESHIARNIFIVLAVLILGSIGLLFFADGRRRAAEEAERQAEGERQAAARAAERERIRAEREDQEAAERARIEAAEDVLRAHKNYGHERFDPENPDKLKTVKRMKEEAAEKQRLFLEAQERREAQARADAAEANARMYRTSAQTVAQPTTTVVNNGGSGDFVTGMLVGNMLSGSHHDHTTIIERETVREVPAPSRSSTWDDTPATSRSSSWDTPSTPSRSSSWDDDSSSKSSSSWSSSSSDSSSSWSDSSSDSSSSSDW